MSEKGYYGWIHGLKNAAMQSHSNGQKLLREEAEEKAKRLPPGRREALLQKLKGVSPTRPAKPTTSEETGEEPISIEDESGKVVETVPFGTARQEFVRGMRDLQKEKVPEFADPTTPDTVMAAGGDPTTFSDIELTKRVKDLKLVADVNGNGKTDANDAAGQAHAWEAEHLPSSSMSGFESGARQPNFPLAAQARIEADRPLPNDMMPARRIMPPGQRTHEQPWYDPEEARRMVSLLNREYDPSEAVRDEDEDTRYLGIDMSGQLGANVRESIAHKIRKMLNG